FELDDYRHEARWNNDESRIEMHLVAQANQCVEIGDQAFSLKAGESIHTENSRKFSDGQLRALLAGTGWSLDHAWRSPDHRVSLFWLESELVETTAE
ncbi:MAG: L-histidine N(alpha)-methyltransferase, partial [Pseudomonadota bacterium]